MKKVHTLVRYLEICDGNMQEGSFRCDANVSVRQQGAEKFGTRAEIKNINSFRFVEKAINYEVARQIELLEGGGKVVQETRLYDPDKGETRSMRSKEEANDYRYFPDPDLLPVELDDGVHRRACEATLPELPDQKARALRARSTACRSTTPACSPRAASSRHYYEDVAQRQLAGASAKLAANWVMGELAAALNKRRPGDRREPHRRRSARRAAGAHRRQHHLRQDRQGRVRGHVGGGQGRRCHHRVEGPASRSPTPARSRRPSTK